MSCRFKNFVQPELIHINWFIWLAFYRPNYSPMWKTENNTMEDPNHKIMPEVSLIQWPTNYIHI